ncbi:MinD/ParA family ATP-binding protein [Geotoga petraea]|jgi:flagellar biosynthesis protein FlhG|uniref:Flagellar biosynthesis protein FlhG n=1 Tax=Geotoga petraea TaxID=28234 RepID=A0A1G6K2I7_9BACT|nr:P-loop NTPase [Geotoga petraea]MDK2946537.1 flagellar biosynthesis protein FlhG [Geotoga sp.]TGG88401.1 MinD/ParA family protein [Geotoga petraea]SDC25143.1 flagellar biosynthesis protein FlhG [Geotoga petraea]
MSPGYQDQAESLRSQFKKSDTKIISISGGKGGVGKSVFAVNLSAELAKREKSVLLFDSDAGFANAAILLGKNVKYNMSDYIDGRATLDQCIQETKYGVDVISSGFDFKDWKLFQNGFTSSMTEDFFLKAKDHDYLIIDIGAGYSDKLNSFYLASDKIFLITIPEPTAIVNAYTLIKALSFIGVHSELDIILNMIREKSEIEPVKQVIKKTVSNFLGKDIANFYDVYYDKRVHDSIKSQTPIVNQNINNKFKKSLELIVDDILNIEPNNEKSFTKRFKNIFGMS